MEPKLMVVRTDWDNIDWIWKQIQSGYIHQGWGLPNMQLIEKESSVPIEIWKTRYIDSAKEYWGVDVADVEAEKRYWILHPMTDLKKGDIVVVPHMPEWSSFIIVRVNGEYSYDDNPAAERDDLEDYRHRIQIDSDSIKTFNYASCEEARTISKKFRAYQSAVKNVWNEPFIEAVNSLLLKESDTVSKDISTIFRDIKSDLVSPLLERVRNLTPRDLEDLVANLFESNGYLIIGRNDFDGEGGDVDITATYRLPIVSDQTDTDLKVYIQVKQKDGRDYNDAEGVNQLHKMSKLEPNVQKILVNTTNDFSESTKALASEHNVILINGPQIIEMMAKHL